MFWIELRAGTEAKQQAAYHAPRNSECPHFPFTSKDCDDAGLGIGNAAARETEEAAGK